MFRTVWRFSRLRADERHAVVVASALLVVVRVSLAVCRFSRVRRLVTWLGRRQWGVVERADVVAWAVSTAGDRLPGEFTCLPRALVGYAMLRAGGHDPTLHVGVSKRDADVEAHSWVSVDGAVVVGDLPTLDRFESFGPVSSWPTSDGDGRTVD